MMKRIILLSIIIFGIVCSSPKKNIPSINLNNILKTNLGEFERISNAKIFDADQLVENSIPSADEYLRYGIIQAANANYKKDSITYPVDIFEFSSRYGAFGIYARKRMPDDSFISVGTQSLIGQGYLYYFKDRFVITINSFGNDLPDLQSLTDLASSLDNLLPGAEMFPIETFVFPEKRLIANSQQFWPKGFDNYAVPESCWSADYSRYGKTCRLFFSLNRENIEYDTFTKLIQKKGRILKHMAGVGGNSVYAINDDDGKILLGYSDRVIFGVLDVSNDYWAKALCEALFENLGKKL